MSSAVIDIRWFWVAPGWSSPSPAWPGCSRPRYALARHPFARPRCRRRMPRARCCASQEWICIVGVPVAGLLAAAVGWSRALCIPGWWSISGGGMMHDPFSAFFQGGGGGGDAPGRGDDRPATGAPSPTARRMCALLTPGDAGDLSSWRRPPNWWCFFLGGGVPQHRLLCAGWLPEERAAFPPRRGSNTSSLAPSAPPSCSTVCRSFTG